MTKGVEAVIRESFLRFLYEAAGMQRWNDHIRPHKGFTELDKQAQKMFYAYVIGKLEEAHGGIPVDWTGLIEGGIFEFFHRILLTDIKPPIFHKLMERQGEALNRLVLEKLKDRGVYELEPGLGQRLEAYFFDPCYNAHEKRLLKASHYLATSWEFEIIYRLNSGLFGLEDTRRQIESQVEEHSDIPGVKRLLLDRGLRDFMNLIGQLRFQQRWAQTPRIPETSVAGHMLIVAVLSYVFSLELSACSKRKYNNFFAGLFHDMPEVLTRDIISPVKESSEELGRLIKEIEDSQMQEVIFPLLPEAWQKEIRYFTENEFVSKIVTDEGIREVESEEINRAYDQDTFSPLDGRIIRICDKFAAYMEAYLSIHHGISSRNLQDGHKYLYEKYRKSTVAGLNTGVLFDYFRMG